MNEADPFELDRFVQAQASTYGEALQEIADGKKRGHWMWFIFPQALGLGTSAMARDYAIRSLDEAVAYLAHPLLGVRYVECVLALQNLAGGTAEQIFGDIDATKLRSSLTLFERAGGPAILSETIERWLGGKRDEMTLDIVGRETN